MTWFSIIVSGIVTYFSRMAMVALIDREMLGTKIKEVLNYVPAAVFPAIIFPGVFFNDVGSLVEYSDPKIIVNSQKKLNDKYTMVSSVLIATDDKPEVKVDWRVITKDPDNPLIIDLIIEGVSLAKVQKQEFYSIIQSNDGDINALLKNLKIFVEKE